MENNDNNNQEVNERRELLLHETNYLEALEELVLKDRMKNLGHTVGTDEYTRVEGEVMNQMREIVQNSSPFINRRTTRQLFELKDCPEADRVNKAQQYAKDYVNLTSPNYVLGNARLSDEQYERQDGTRTIFE